MPKGIILLTIGVLILSPSWGWSSPPAYDPGVGDPIQVLESDAHHLILGISGLEVNLQEVVMLDDNTYTFIYTQGSISGQVGAPDVPIFTAWILVPNGTQPTLVVNPSLTRVLGLEHTLSPVQYDYVDLEGAPTYDFVIDEAAYATPGGYPPRFGELGEVQHMRGQDMVLVKLYPVRYNHAERQLYIYDLELMISFEGEIQPFSPGLADQDFDAMYRDLSLNGEQVLPAEYEAAPPDAGHFGPYGWVYLIFTDPMFQIAADTLAAWKTQSGYKTLVTTVPKKMKPEDLKKALINAYLTWDIKPKYVLLIGDAEHIAPFYKTWHDFNSTGLHGKLDTQGYIGTDLYYSTLKSSYPGLPDFDLIPEVLVGRLSVDTAYQADDLIAAIIHYEKNPPADASFYNTAVLAAQFQDGGVTEIFNPNTGQTFTQTLLTNGIEDKRFTQTTEDVAIFLESADVGKTGIQRLYYGGFDRAVASEYPKKWNNNHDLIIDWTNFDGPRKNTLVNGLIPGYLGYNPSNPSSFQWDADQSKISAAINNGTFLVTHRDHGGRTRWSDPLFENLDVGLLNNRNKLPVVWSMNCQTGWFDNETDFSKKPGITDLTAFSDVGFSEMWGRTLASAITNDDYGAVGVLAATRVSYGSINERLFEGLVDAIWPKYFEANPKDKPLYEMGAVIAQAKTYMASKTASDIRNTIQQEVYLWFGDPSMKIRTQPPLPMVVLKQSDPWYWALHPHDLQIYVKDSNNNAIKDAKVTLKKSGDQGGDFSNDFEEPLDFWTAITNEEGLAIFTELKTNDAGAYELVVTASNALPYESTLDVEPGSPGGIALDSEVYPCETTVQVKVADIDLAGQRSLDIDFTTAPGDDAEVVTLYPGAVLGLFTGNIRARCGHAELHNGWLDVSNGVMITARYYDASVELDDEPSPATVEDSAVVDTEPPDFGGLSTAVSEGCSVHLSWEAAGEPHGLVAYKVYRGVTPGGPFSTYLGSTWLLSWTDDLCLSSGTYYYNVIAEDAVGNETQKPIAPAVTVYNLYLPVLNR